MLKKLRSANFSKDKGKEKAVIDVFVAERNMGANQPNNKWLQPGNALYFPSPLNIIRTKIYLDCFWQCRHTFPKLERYLINHEDEILETVGVRSFQRIAHNILKILRNTFDKVVECTKRSQLMYQPSGRPNWMESRELN